MDTAQYEDGPGEDNMHVYGPSHVHGPQHISAPHGARAGQASAPAALSLPHDELSISDAGRLVEAARALPDIRADRVAQIKSQLAAGTYMNDAKLDLALERLLDEIA